MSERQRPGVAAAVDATPVSLAVPSGLAPQGAIRPRIRALGGRSDPERVRSCERRAHGRCLATPDLDPLRHLPLPMELEPDGTPWVRWATGDSLGAGGALMTTVTERIGLASTGTFESVETRSGSQPRWR